jgi:transposase
MVDGRTEQNIERLRAAFLLTERHAKSLAQENVDLRLRIAHLEGRVLSQDELQLPLPEAEEIVIDTLDNPEDNGDLVLRPSPGPGQDEVKRPGHGPRRQPALPCREELIVLPEGEEVCPSCQQARTRMGDATEDAEEITVVERSYVLVVRKRAKYTCGCADTITTAPAPKRVIPGGRYSNDFAISVAVDKYADNIPLERQVERMARHGLELTSSVLVDQLHGLTTLLEPVWREMLIYLLDHETVINVDETGWRLSIGRDKRRSVAWVVCSPRAVVHNLMASKGGKVAERLLGPYEGVVVADGYQVYTSLAKAKAKSGFQLANCWAHVLRKFRDEVDNDARAKEVLRLIGRLYRIEEQAWPFPGDVEVRQRRAELRALWSRPVAEELRSWSLQQGGLRRSSFGKALGYMLKRWDELTLFLDNPLIPIDNNHAERSLRKLVTGRKVHFGSRSEPGLRFAEVHYSLIDSCRINGVPPLDYYRHIVGLRLEDPSQIVLPHEFAAQHDDAHEKN